MNIDLSYLEDITGGDRAVILEMLDLFIRDIPIQIQKIHNHYQSSEMIEMGKEAHKVKPTLQYIGLSNMFEDIKAIEQIVKTGENKASLEEIISRLQSATEECVPALIAKREQLS